MSYVVISMTTVPRRNGTLAPTLDSLYAQTRPADEIRLYTTPGCAIPADLAGYPTADFGPVTKISAVTDKTLRDETIVVTVDDDIVYHPQWLARLVKGAEDYPDCAVGMAGWNIKLPFRYVRLPVERCDVLEGWAGVAYRKKFFENDILLAPHYAKWVDDVWISAYLMKKNIRRMVVHEPLALPTPLGHTSGIHTWPDFQALNRRAALLCFGASQ